MKPIRHSISWDQIDARGAVFGTGPLESVSIHGYNFTVRLMRGSGNDPTDSYADADRGSVWASDGNWKADKQNE